MHKSLLVHRDKSPKHFKSNISSTHLNHCPLQSIFRGYKRLFGMTAEAYNENGDLLDSVDINNSRKRVSFSFNKEDALLGNNRSNVTGIHSIHIGTLVSLKHDQSADPVTLASASIVYRVTLSELA